MKNAFFICCVFFLACSNYDSKTKEDRNRGLTELEKIFEGYSPPKYIEDSALLAKVSEFNPSLKWIEIDSVFSYRKIHTNQQNSFDSIYFLAIGYYDSQGTFNVIENIPELIYFKDSLQISKKIDSVILKENYNIELKIKDSHLVNLNPKHFSYIDLSFDHISYKTDMSNLKNKLMSFNFFDSIAIKMDGLMFLFLKKNYQNVDSIELILPRIKSLDSHIVCKTRYEHLLGKDLVFYITPKILMN